MHRFLIRSSSSPRGITAASSSAIFSSSTSASTFSSSSELKPLKWASDSGDDNKNCVASTPAATLPSLPSCTSNLPIEINSNDGISETFCEPPNKKLKQQTDIVFRGKDDGGTATKTEGDGKGKGFNDNSGNNNSNSIVSTTNVGDRGNSTTNGGDDPMSLMTWNMNGLLVRLKIPEQWQQFISFVECHRPDVIGLQEVRLPVNPAPPSSSSFFFGNAGGKGKTKGKGEEEEGKLRERHRIKGTDKTSLKEKEMVEMAMRRGVMANYNVWWSLANTKYAGQAMLIRRELQPTHMWFTLENCLQYLSLTTSCSSVSSSSISSSTSSTSTETMSASFSSSSTSSTQTISENTETAVSAESSLSAVTPAVPIALSSLLSTASSISSSSSFSAQNTTVPLYSTSPSSFSAHDDEGRIIIAKFPSFFLLSVYAPNIGGGVERRRRWDERLELFVSALQKASQRLVWMGDFNCAPLDVDLSHPPWFKNQRFPFNNKNTSTSFSSSSFSELNSPTAYLGQPGCTSAERFYFHRIVAAGDLLDVYRLLHPLSLSSPPPPVSSCGYTWRGHPGRENPHAAKYYAKGMRIDHFLISRTLERNIMSVENMGKGAERVGFMGSDHCPVVLKFKPKMSE